MIKMMYMILMEIVMMMIAKYNIQDRHEVKNLESCMQVLIKIIDFFKNLNIH